MTRALAAAAILSLMRKVAPAIVLSNPRVTSAQVYPLFKVRREAR